MTGLFAAELRRAWSRRVVRGIGLGVLALVLTFGITNFFTSNTDLDRARAQAQRDIAMCEREEDRQRELEPDAPPGSFDFGCGTVEENIQNYDDSYTYSEDVSGTSRGIGTFLIVVGFILGASFVGAEWGTGSMTTLLTWEPRRHRVLISKLATIGVVAAAGAVVALIILALVNLPAGNFRGTMDGTGGRFWREVAGIWGRSAALTGMFAIAGGALAIIVRNTAGTVTAGALYAAVADPLLSTWREGRHAVWFLTRNVAGFMGFAVPVAEETTDQFGGTSFEVAVPAIWGPALRLSIYSLVLIGIAYAIFQRRDVT